jgi:hypothetical protein
LSNYLRVTRDDYQAIRSACALYAFGNSSGRFQRFLAETLRPSHVALAAWVDGLSRKQARIVRLHVEGEAVGSRS